jgi:polygalacturonase
MYREVFMLTRKVISLLLVLAVALTGFIPQAASAADTISYTGSADPASLAPQTTGGPAVIQNYPMPSIYTPSDVFTLKADQEDVPVVKYLPEYDYAQFSFAGTVTIEVTANQPITTYSISPLAKNIQGTVDGNKLTFTLSTSTYVIVDINEAPNENPDEKDPEKKRKRLVIAADPLETDIPASSGPGIYNVTDAPYNADSTGATITSDAIQQAIDDAHAAGGGIVFIPAGVYTSSNLTLKSNVTFYLAGGAVIVGTGRGEDYRNDFRKDSISDGTYFIRTETNSENITMQGRGTIDGKGIEMRKRKMVNPPRKEGLPEERQHKNGQGFINNLVVPMATSHFTFDGLTLRDGGFWAFLIVRSDDVKITNYKGYQDLYTLEDDAIDINESQNVLVKHAIAISDDDTFSTKTWPQKGMSKDWPGEIEHLENVIFDDCLAWTRCAAFKLGMGICTPQIGVTIRNSYVYQAARALLVDHAYTENPLPEEGWARDITFENIDIERVGISQFGNYWVRVSTSTAGDVSNILFKNINVRDTGGETSPIQGNPTRGGMVNGVTFTDVVVKGKLAKSLADMKASVRNDNVSGLVIANTTPAIFSDNFEDGDTAGWTTVAGTWAVTAEDGNQVLSTSKTQTALITANAGAAWTDYTYEAKVKVPLINNEENAGLVFRVKDDKNFYMYRMNAKTKKMELFKSVEGTMTSVSDTPFAPTKQWYTMKVIVKGNTVKGYVDGELKTEWTNPTTELTSGGVGFRTTSAKVLFDDATVTATNEAPTDIVLSHNSVAENTTPGGIVGTLSTIDPDASEPFAYALVSGQGDTDNSSFSIAVLGNTLIVRAEPDYETKNSYTIRVRSTDSGGLYVEKSFTIHVTDADETPVVTNPNALLFSDDFEDGNSTGWTSNGGTWNVAADDTKILVQKANTTGLITAGDTWTDYVYEAKVRVPISNANAGLVFRMLDNKNFYMYRINTSAQKLELYKSVDGVMTNVSSKTFTTAAKQWYTLKVIVQGNTVKGFVDGERIMEWTNPVTELTAGKIGFRTTSVDAAFDQVVVTGINKAPADISLTQTSVSEQSPAGSTVGSFSTTDPDEGDTFTYSLSAGEGDTGNASFAISGNTLQTVTAMVYDTQNSYSIRVRSTDAGGLYTEKPFTITVVKSGVHLADSANNSVTLDRSRVAAGSTVTLTAAGDRQSADGSVPGDEKFIPATWSSTESGKNGGFQWDGEKGAYISGYTASEAGTHVVTAVFQKMNWNGSSWGTGATDTKTVTLNVYAPGNAEGNSLHIAPSSTVVGQTVIITAEGYNQGLTPSVVGDERYIPAVWSSTEAGKSGEFTVTGQVYQAAYVPAQAGSFTITATYQKQVWDGTVWTNDITDTRSANLTVIAPVEEEPSPSTGGVTPGTVTPTASVGTTVTTQENGQTVTTISVDPSKLEQKLTQAATGGTITIPVDTASDKVVVVLTGDMLKSMENKAAVLELQTEKATYTLPAAQIQMEDIARQLGVQSELKDIQINITIAAPSADTVKQVQDIAKQQGYQLAAEPVEFNITAASGNKTTDISTFTGYVERTIALTEGTVPGKVTTGIVLNTDGSFSHVPTSIVLTGGKYYATINSLTNSTYAVIYSPKTFADVHTHWAKDTVNDMASRLIMEGSGEGRFEPDRDITRAEFAAVMVKGLGLMRPGSGKDVFKDVAKGSWYYDAVAIAYANGIIDGYEDGTFGPMETITREQAMVMTARAMKLTGLKAELTADMADQLLAGFTDAGEAADYAKLSMAASIKTGIITGRDSDTAAPKSNITRAEVAVIVKRLLHASGLI